MALNPNMFAMTPVAGDLDLQNRAVIAAMVSTNQATALVAGQAVKLEDSATGVPSVLALTANTDLTFGFVVRTLKDISFPTLAAVEIAMGGSVMLMTAGAAIARGAKLEVVYTTNKVITNAGTNPVCGIALDQAQADTNLIRVLVISPSVDYSQVIGDIAGLVTALANKADIGVPTITLAAGATNSINATITMKNSAGAAITAIQYVDVFLSTSATGALVSATSYSGALTASTGAIIAAITATKVIRAVTDVNGVLVLNLVASGKPATEYFCVAIPGTNKLIVSAASGTSWGA